SLHIRLRRPFLYAVALVSPFNICRVCCSIARTSCALTSPTGRCALTRIARKPVCALHILYKRQCKLYCVRVLNKNLLNLCGQVLLCTLKERKRILRERVAHLFLHSPVHLKRSVRVGLSAHRTVQEVVVDKLPHCRAVLSNFGR